MKYTVVVNQTEYGYDVHCPALPGCHSQGDTFEEAIENIRDAISTYIQIIKEETSKTRGLLMKDLKNFFRNTNS